MPSDMPALNAISTNTFENRDYDLAPVSPAAAALTYSPPRLASAYLARVKAGLWSDYRRPTMLYRDQQMVGQSIRAKKSGKVVRGFT